MSAQGSRSALAGAVRSEPLPLRVHPLVLGMVIFLASETMLFAAMFAAYYELRSQAAVWPPSGVSFSVIEASTGTALLAFSSLTMFLATRSLSRKRHGAARAWFVGTCGLGMLFLGLTVHGWSDAKFHISSHAYGSLFYLMLGVHALHVLVGIVLIAMLALGVRERAFLREEDAGAEAIGYYWHFVFAVWFVGIWPTIYLVK